MQYAQNPGGNTLFKSQLTVVNILKSLSQYRTSITTDFTLSYLQTHNWPI